jgi:hypothetical protein
VPNPNPAHPPFEVGNAMARKHGAYSDAVVMPRAQELVDELLALAAEPKSRTAYLADPAFFAAVGDYAVLRARKEKLELWLAEQGGDLDGKGNVRPATQLLARIDAQVASAQRELGLTPAARARLSRDVALAGGHGGLDLSEGRRLRLEAEARQRAALEQGDEADDDGQGQAETEGVAS